MGCPTGTWWDCVEVDMESFYLLNSAEDRDLWR